MNDWQLSQWISQWLAGELDDVQQAQLRAALQQSPASQRFAQWSSRIQAAAAETQLIETMPPDVVSLEPTECLSELSKARLQRAVLDALNPGRQSAEPQQFLRVAQSPSDYAAPPVPNRAAATAQEHSGSNQGFDDLLRGGRELRGRLTTELSSMLQTLQWVVEMAHQLSAHGTGLHAASVQHTGTQPTGTQPTGIQPTGTQSSRPSSSLSADNSDDSEISLQQLGRIIMAMLRVQTSLCGVSIASYRAPRFDELLRVQRGPRNASDLTSLPTDRLRHAAASPFHQSVVAAAGQTPSLTLDRSIAGWPRIVLGLPLCMRHRQADNLSRKSSTADPTAGAASTGTAATGETSSDTTSSSSAATGEPWGLALVEADIERLVNTHIAAASVSALVTLLDGQDRVLFSNLPHVEAATLLIDKFIGDDLCVTDELVHTGEMHRPANGTWCTLLSCPAPFDNLRLILHRD